MIKIYAPSVLLETIRPLKALQLYYCLNNDAKSMWVHSRFNKAGYTAILVACGWAGAVLDYVARASGQEPYAQKTQKRRKSKKGINQPTNRPTDIVGC